MCMSNDLVLFSMQYIQAAWLYFFTVMFFLFVFFGTHPKSNVNIIPDWGCKDKIYIVWPI